MNFKSFSMMMSQTRQFRPDWKVGMLRRIYPAQKLSQFLRQAGAEIAKYELIGAEFHYFCYLAQKYSIGKNVYLTTATPRKVPRSSDNHDNAVLQCTLTSRYHKEARELMYRSLLHRYHLILRNFFPK